MSASAPDPLPQIARARSILFTVPPAGRRWGIGLRAATAIAIPGMLVVAAGQPGSAIYAMYGAFALLYGEGRPYRTRGWIVLTAGTSLVLATALGALVGRHTPPGAAAAFAAVLLMTAVAVPAVYAVDALRLGPPGALYFVLVSGGALGATQWGMNPVPILVCSMIGTLSAVVVSISGALVDPHKPERTAVERAVAAVDAYSRPGNNTVDARHSAGVAVATAWNALHDAGVSTDSDDPLLATLRETHRRFTAMSFEPKNLVDHLIPGDQILLVRPTTWYRLRRSMHWQSHAVVTAGRVGLACLSAGALSIAAGLARPQWAILSAVVIVHLGPDRLHGNVRGLQRFAGTVIGLGLFGALYELSVSGYTLVAAIAVLIFCSQLFVSRNYALTVLFVTPIALLAAGVATLHGPVGSIVADRLAETVIGVVVALASMYLVAPHAHRRTFTFTQTRVRLSAQRLVELARKVPAHDAVYSESRDLTFELEGAIRAAIDSAHDEPIWLQTRWPAHALLIHRGYDLMAACWATPPGLMLTGADRWESLFIRPQHPEL